MTDEEMAKDYAEHNQGKYTNEFGNLYHAFLAGIEAGKDMAETDLATIAYMQGAERYRPKWHKVADGELPKQDDVYLLYTTKGFLLGHYEQGGSDGKVDFCGESYSDFTEYPSEEEFMENEVIAWCEIPQYTEG